MKNLKDFVKAINRYHKFIENEDFDGAEKMLEKYGIEDGDIVYGCEEFAEKNNIETFTTKSFSSPGYDLSSYVYVWKDKDGEIDGVVLNVESF